MFEEEAPNETKFAKLSPVEVAAGFDGELDRFEAADRGVDLPEVLFCRVLGTKRPEDIGGGLLAGAFELEDQLSPLRSSMAGKAMPVADSSKMGVF